MQEEIEAKRVGLCGGEPFPQACGCTAPEGEASPLAHDVYLPKP
jgi:hypothetical protein